MSSAVRARQESDKQLRMIIDKYRVAIEMGEWSQPVSIHKFDLRWLCAAAERSLSLEKSDEAE